MRGSPLTVDEVLDRLRDQGARMTTARRAVVGALLAAGDRHITTDDVVAWVQARHPEVHRSTVYRTLERLEHTGMLEHVHLGHGPSSYHLTDRPHHHAICDRCHAVIELPADVLDGVCRQLRSEHGFELTRQHFALTGLCRGCADQA